MPNTIEDIINDELSESMKQVAQTINGLLAEKDRRIKELESQKVRLISEMQYLTDYVTEHADERTVDARRLLAEILETPEHKLEGR